MHIKVTFSIEIDELQFKNLTKTEIRKIVKEYEQDGSTIDYIKENVSNELSDMNYEKSKS